ncbi:MAG: adenosylcobalamin-dependent ribonucleoside-diphosphate reductase, partial [Anaerolineales bacterium]
MAKVEEAWQGQVSQSANEFYELLSTRRFFPNSPTFTGAGTPLGQLAACFVLPISDDMGRNSMGIFQTLRDAALIQQTGGGNGFAFSRLRPKRSVVISSSGQATGPVGFLRVYDKAFGEIAQGGTRRGANMGVLRVDHPDIEEFVTCKTDENAITNFNISVGITDAFMEAVKNDGDWDLVFPDVNDPRYRDFNGTLEQAVAAGLPLVKHKTVRARALYDQIVRQAHFNGEPGVLFLDAANRSNPVPHLYGLEATNPCGEQWLGPYENCCLGSLNLAEHCGLEGSVDWQKLEQSVALATRFLDDVVEANAYVPAVPQLREAALRARRIGLGIMGLADLMYHAGIRYGSPEGQEFAAQVMEFVRYHSMQTSIKLAEARGPFAAITGSIYDPQNLVWTPPQPLAAYTQDFDRPTLDWEQVVVGIRRHGIRNAAQTTIAPTGTIATVAGCEGYGCEPVFALAYIRHVNDHGRDLQLAYTSPLFERALIASGLDEEERAEIIDAVMADGTCQNTDLVPDALRDVFVVSADITADEHVRMQAALQAFVDNSLSKTINFPPEATTEDVATAYQLAWELGCKGLTVYVTGSREKVVLETHATAKEKAGEFAGAEAAQQVAEQVAQHLTIW